GDGDRLGVVTKSGKIIYPDRQLMLFAAEVLGRNPGAEVIFDVKSTRNLFDWIRQHGGKPLLWKTGHSLIKAKLKETGAPLEGATEVNTIDGLRVEYPDGFGLMRASNTTPVIVLRFEADSPEALARIQGDFKRVLSKAKPDASLPY